MITLTKIREEEKSTKSNKGKATNNIQGNFHHAVADFSAETLQARREWHNIFKVMKGNNLQPRMLCPARLSLRFDGKIKTFIDKQKPREFSTIRPALQYTVKEIL